MSVQAAPVERLEDSRSRIGFNALDRKAKQQIVADAQRMYQDYYVHNADPKSAFLDGLDALAQQLDTLPTGLFHHRMQALFAAEDDPNLRYIFPAPYQCYHLTQLIALRPALGDDDQLSIVIDKILPFFEFSPSLKDLSVGDRIISVDGQSIEQMLAIQAAPGDEQFQWQRWQASALQNITFKNLLSAPLPKSDQLIYEIENSRGERRQVILPWISIEDEPCLSGELQPSVAAQNYDSLVANARAKQQQLMAELFGSTVTGLQQQFPQWIQTHPTVSSIHWATLEVQEKRFAYLALADFNGQEAGLSAYLDGVRSLLNEQLAGTQGLILDVRDNWGGALVLAQLLPRLFAPQSYQGFLLQGEQSQSNDQVFARLSEHSNGQVQSQLKRYYDSMPAIDADLIEGIGERIYFGPIAILTNNYCQAACDVFVALMQAFAGAELWAESSEVTLQTSIESRFSHLQQLAAGDTEGASSTDQDMVLAWLSLFHNDLSNVQPVPKERLVFPTIADIKGNSYSQLTRISDALAELKNIPVIHLPIANDSGDNTIQFSAEHVDEVLVYHGGHVLASYVQTAAKQTNTLSLYGLPKNLELSFIGLRGGEVVFKTKQSFSHASAHTSNGFTF